MRRGPESRLPDEVELAALVNADGIDGVAARFGVTRDAVWVKLNRAGYVADTQGDHHPVYTRSLVARCSRCGQDKPRDDFYRDAQRPNGLQRWCKRCANDRPSATTNKRVLRSRARNWAVARLIEKHRAEFDTLMEQAWTEVKAEAAAAAAVAPAPTPPTPTPTPAPASKPVGETPVPRLKPGPRNRGETVLARIKMLCTACATFHQAGHTCPTCAGTHPHRRNGHRAAQVPVRDDDQTRSEAAWAMFTEGHTVEKVMATLNVYPKQARDWYEAWRRANRVVSV